MQQEDEAAQVMQKLLRYSNALGNVTLYVLLTYRHINQRTISKNIK